MPRDPRRRTRSLDVYLLPTVLGSGRGDIEDVLSAGNRLRSNGARVRLHVQRTTDKPWLLDLTFGWRRFPRTARLLPRRRRALTLTSHFGVTAPDPREEPLGGPGAWTTERRAIEASYGPERTLHVSLEEFARTPTSRRQADERHREGGRSTRERRRRRAEIAREAEEAHGLYRKFRALDRPNLLALFPTFAPSRAFAREFPETVQCGPLWPPAPAAAARPPRRPGVVVWYASPSSSPRIGPGIRAGLARSGGQRLEVRSTAAFDVPGPHPPTVVFLPPEGRRAWDRRWSSARLRIATGSRSLLEAIHAGGPFLYFNGVLGSGAATRRHRPEKLASLVQLWRHHGVEAAVRRDLLDFARGRRVAEIVAKAVGDTAWRRQFPRRVPVVGFPAGFEAAGDLLVTVAERFSTGEGTSESLVRSIRAESRASKV